MTRLVQLLRQNFGKQQQRTKSLHLYISGMFYSGRKSHILFYKKSLLHDFYQKDLGREFFRDNENFDDLHSMHAETLKQNLLLLLQKYYVKGSLLVMECPITGILRSAFDPQKLFPLKMGGSSGKFRICFRDQYNLVHKAE